MNHAIKIIQNHRRANRVTLRDLEAERDEAKQRLEEFFGELGYD